MTFSREDPRRQLTVRIDDELHEDLTEYVEQYDTDKSAATRKALRLLIGQRKPDRDDPPTGKHPPTDDAKLHKAYLMLLDLAGTSDYIREDLALPPIAQAVGLPKDAVKVGTMRELQRRGYIRRTNDSYGQQAAYKILR